MAVEGGTWEANLIVFCATAIYETIDTIDHAHMKHSKMGNALTNIWCLYTAANEICSVDIY